MRRRSSCAGQGCFSPRTRPADSRLSVWVEFHQNGCSFDCTTLFALGSVLLMDGNPPVPEGKVWVITPSGVAVL